MMRVVLFIATNLAVLLVLSVVMKLLGLESLLAQNGVDLNLGAVLVYSAVIGTIGSCACCSCDVHGPQSNGQP